MQSMVERAVGTIDNNLIGAFLYGSQNYGLDYDGSDIDVIVLVREGDKPKKEIKTKTGEIKIYTLKYFLYLLQKGDMECYEILYTKHRFINPDYREEVAKFISNFSAVLNIERIKYALYLKLDEHLSSIMWIKFNRGNARYNKKRLYWALRVKNQLSRLAGGERLETSFLYDIEDRENLIQIKTVENFLSLKELGQKIRGLRDFLKTCAPRSVTINDKEQKCLSEFYNDLQ